MKISDAIRSVMCNALVDALDAGGAGSLFFFSGSAPTNTTDADSGTELAVLPFAATAFGAASAGVATSAAITSDTTVVGGTAAHFRAKSGAGTVIFQGTVAKTSGGEINFNENVWLTGGTAAIGLGGITVTVPAS
jgi:hypothetical protein